MKTPLALAVLVCLFAASLSAQSTSAILYLTGQVNDDGSTFTDDPGVTAEFETGVGFGAAVSRMFGANLSGELAIFRTTSSGNVREGGQDVLDLGDLDLTPVTAMLRYHFRPQQRVDVYIGGGIAQVFADDLDSDDLRAEGLGPVEIEDKTTGVLGAGVTVNLSERWGLVFDARYLPLDLSASAGGENASAQLDPLLISAGVRIAF